jgi:hypothetical protein
MKQSFKNDLKDIINYSQVSIEQKNPDYLRIEDLNLTSS